MAESQSSPATEFVRGIGPLAAISMVVGTMIAKDVPMHSCMRISSGTSSTRNTS